jgi:hypothetical protein
VDQAGGELAPAAFDAVDHDAVAACPPLKRAPAMVILCQWDAHPTQQLGPTCAHRLSSTCRPVLRSRTPAIFFTQSSAESSAPAYVPSIDSTGDNIVDTVGDLTAALFTQPSEITRGTVDEITWCSRRSRCMRMRLV